MAISTYADLKSAVARWIARSDVMGDAEDFIALAEARLNRKLGLVDQDATLTGTIGSRQVSIAALDMSEPIALFLAETGRDEVQVTQQAGGTFPYLDTDGPPSIWTVDGDYLKFERQLDQAYPFRFLFKGRFRLSDTVTTNWLLTNHPDVYLSASLVWGGVFTKNDSDAVRYKALLEETLPEVEHEIAQSKRGTLAVDTALLPRRRYMDLTVA